MSDASPSRPRGYTVVSGLVVLVFAGLWAFEGYYVVTAWIPALYDEVTPINGVAAGGYMTVMLVCAVAALWRPREAVGPSKVLVVGAGLLGLLMPLAFVLSAPLVTAVGIAVAAAVLGTFLRLHPARQALDPRRSMALSLPLVVVTLTLAVPALWWALELQWSQVTLEDDLADRWFYGGLAMYLTATVAFAGLASIDGESRRSLGGVAVVLAGLLGAVSVVYPDEIHSLGVIGGALVLAWCVALCGALLASK